MDQGIFGVSTGLIYPPNAFANVDELSEVSKAAAAKGGLYASHLRYDGLKLRDGIEEAIAIGERAGIPVHVFHIKVTGQKNVGRMKEVIGLIEAARARGVRVTADQYPYVASSTSLTATIPPWAQDGGTDKLIARLKDPKERARIRKEMENTNPSWESRYQSAGTWQNVQLAAIGRTRGAADAGVSPNRKYEGMRVAEAAKQAGKDPFDFVFDLLIEERGSIGCVYFIIDEGDLALAMKQPWVAVGSDGSALATDGPLRAGVPHPRNFGTFPRVLGRYVRELKVIPLEEAIRKMTSLPASVLGLEDRGSIKEGMWADLVMFDPATVADKATFEDPFQYPVGIDTVLVNGTVVLDEGKHTNARPGKVLKRASPGHQRHPGTLRHLALSPGHQVFDPRDARQVVVDHRHHQRHQQHEADEQHLLLHLEAEVAAGNRLDRHDEDVAAVEDRDRHQVQQSEVQADPGHQAEQRNPAGLRGLAGQLRDADGSHQLFR